MALMHFCTSDKEGCRKLEVDYLSYLQRGGTREFIRAVCIVVVAFLLDSVRLLPALYEGEHTALAIIFLVVAVVVVSVFVCVMVGLNVALHMSSTSAAQQREARACSTSQWSVLSPLFCEKLLCAGVLGLSLFGLYGEVSTASCPFFGGYAAGADTSTRLSQVQLNHSMGNASHVSVQNVADVLDHHARRHLCYENIAPDPMMFLSIILPSTMFLIRFSACLALNIVQFLAVVAVSFYTKNSIDAIEAQSESFLALGVVSDGNGCLPYRLLLAKWLLYFVVCCVAAASAFKRDQVRRRDFLQRQELDGMRGKVQELYETLSRQVVATLPPHVVDRLLSRKKVRDYVPAAGVMVFGISNFSSWSSHSSCTEVVETLNQLFCVLDEELAHHSLVTKMQTLGDLYIAVSGLRPSDSDFDGRGPSADEASLDAATHRHHMRALGASRSVFLFATSALRACSRVTMHSRVKSSVALHSGPVVATFLGNTAAYVAVGEGVTTCIATLRANTNRVEADDSILSTVRFRQLLGEAMIQASQDGSSGGAAVDTPAAAQRHSAVDFVSVAAQESLPAAFSASQNLHSPKAVRRLRNRKPGSQRHSGSSSLPDDTASAAAVAAASSHGAYAAPSPKAAVCDRSFRPEDIRRLQAVLASCETIFQQDTPPATPANPLHSSGSQRSCRRASDSVFSDVVPPAEFTTSAVESHPTTTDAFETEHYCLLCQRFVDAEQQRRFENYCKSLSENRERSAYGRYVELVIYGLYTVVALVAQSSEASWQGIVGHVLAALAWGATLLSMTCGAAQSWAVLSNTNPANSTHAADRDQHAPQPSSKKCWYFGLVCFIAANFIVPPSWGLCTALHIWIAALLWRSVSRVTLGKLHIVVAWDVVTISVPLGAAYITHVARVLSDAPVALFQNTRFRDVAASMTARAPMISFTLQIAWVVLFMLPLVAWLMRIVREEAHRDYFEMTCVFEAETARMKENQQILQDHIRSVIPRHMQDRFEEYNRLHGDVELSNSTEVDPWQGTWYATRVTETPILVLQFQTCQSMARQSSDNADTIAAAARDTRFSSEEFAAQMNDMLTQLADAHYRVDGVLRLMTSVCKAKSAGDTLILIGAEKDDDAVRAMNLLECAAAVSRLFTEADVSAPKIVLNSGLAVGAVIGSDRLTFELFGEVVSTSMELLNAMPTRGIIATQRFVLLYRQLSHDTLPACDPAAPLVPVFPSVESKARSMSGAMAGAAVAPATLENGNSEVPPPLEHMSQSASVIDFTFRLYLSHTNSAAHPAPHQADGSGGPGSFSAADPLVGSSKAPSSTTAAAHRRALCLSPEQLVLTSLRRLDDTYQMSGGPPSTTRLGKAALASSSAQQIHRDTSLPSQASESDRRKTVSSDRVAVISPMGRQRADARNVTKEIYGPATVPICLDFNILPSARPGIAGTAAGTEADALDEHAALQTNVLHAQDWGTDPLAREIDFSAFSHWRVRGCGTIAVHMVHVRPY